ncbi:uncharacterized protein PFL1_03520 [Pseudozyma flocculosa PF-1]|uniref:Rrp15p-domain-containing protein n=2 Tax=Pseudozyma flocculosa TaxID=84751 RepID=A0A5C3F4T0_9BASI|nr:uncharacterized protein PFL1_03520 [Pseudozyma flocculosa PF-1]EPQ28716.1 hypothetical protein PFL1_03520 [Pseudozyma flocculosa PF-1]SPO39513.1 uncharacterized protein PSFLO_04994 [Pseudozyma flocculosa]
MAQGAASSSRPASAAAANNTSKSKAKMTMRAGHATTASTSRTGKPAQSGKPGRRNQAQPDTDDESDLDQIDDDDDLDLEDDADDAEPNTDDEIEASKAAAGGKSKKTAKRKRRATSPTSFGLALEGLLGAAPASSDDEDAAAQGADDDADDHEATDKPAKKRKAAGPSASSSQPAAILSLAPHLRRSAQSVQLSARASRIAIEERRAREERARVKDVIGGWGPPGVLPAIELPGADGAAVKKDDDDEDKMGEWALQGGSAGYERRLRKVAQRGVVKLFNAIRAAQTTTKDDLEEAEEQAAGGPKISGGAKKANALGGKEARLADLSKNNFLDLIRKGTGTGPGGAAKGGVAAK